MITLEKLDEKGVHDVFDDDMDNSYQAKDGEQVVGYLNFQEMKNGSAWVEFILAEVEGVGYGRDMIRALFDLGYHTITGTSIHGPHYFWLAIGATFYEEPDEDTFDGMLFELTLKNFTEAY